MILLIALEIVVYILFLKIKEVLEIPCKKEYH